MVCLYHMTNFFYNIPKHFTMWNRQVYHACDKAFKVPLLFKKYTCDLMTTNS